VEGGGGQGQRPGDLVHRVGAGWTGPRRFQGVPKSTYKEGHGHVRDNYCIRLRAHPGPWENGSQMVRPGRNVNHFTDHVRDANGWFGACAARCHTVGCRK
jgi:hypothetical protein